MDRRAFLRASCAVGGVVLAGCLDDRTAARGDYDVGMSTDSFLPETVEMTAGETLVWRNTSHTGHTVTAYEGAIPDEAAYFASGDFASEDAAREGWNDGGGRIPQGETYEYTFEVPGTYSYFCVPHERENMVGSVEVRAANASTTTADGTNASTDGAPSNGVE